VARDDAGGESRRKAIHVEPTARVSIFHFGFEGPTDVFDPGVAHLESAADFQVARVAAGIGYDVAQQTLAQPDDEVDIGAFELPGRGGVGGDDVDVTVDERSAVLLFSVAATGQHGRADMDTHDDTVGGRSFYEAGRIGKQRYAEMVGTTQVDSLGAEVRN
jgi:hypothetical protein